VNGATSGPTALRASDGDRRAVAERLGTALTDGRLDVGEYDERLARAYAARTQGELAPLLADLPAASGRPRPPAPPGTARSGRAVPLVLMLLWSFWTTAVAVNLLVWTLVSVGNGRPDYFWPMWLAVPGTVLTVVTLLVRALRPKRN
jgi:hypothetical protein